MSKVLYLRAVERALRDAVLPAVTEPVARDSLASCLNILVGVISEMDTAPARPAAGFSLDALPQALRAVFASSALGETPDGLADDIAVRRATISAIVAGRAWIERPQAAVPPQADQATLAALLSWERAQRRDGLAMFAAASGQESSAGTQVGDLEQEKLQRYFTRRYGDAARITGFRRMMGGRSRQTALFSQQGVAELPADLVVQRDPPVPTGAQGVAIQAPVLTAAHAAGVRAPKPWLLECSRDPLGAPFMITERLPGVPIIDATTEYFSPPPPGLRSVALSLAREMAILHRMPIGSLDAVLQPSFDPSAGTWMAEAAGLRARLAELSRGPSIVLAAALAWVDRQAPAIGSRWSVVHNDMLLHNLLMHGGEVSAVLDWEIAHIGHPGEDLGYVRPVIEQIMPWSDFVAAYVQEGGIALTPHESDFFSLYSALQLLTMVQRPRNMFEGGLTADLRLAETASSFIPQLVDRIDQVLRSVMGDRPLAPPR